MRLSFLLSMRTSSLVCTMAVSSSGLLYPQAAAPNTIVGAGYGLLAPVNVAPGQVLTFFVQGVGSTLSTSVRAPSGDLPTSLAGISATLRQGADRSVPIFEVSPVSTCVTNNSQSPCVPGKLTAITVQIPYDLITISEALHRPVTQLAPTQLWVTENGTPGAMIELYPFPDRIHFLTACDTILPTPANPFNETGLPCEPLVTHADGTLVSGSSPAHAGEELVAYATGLGASDPAPASGKVVTAPVSMTSAFVLDFNFKSNAGPSKPVIGAAVPPLFAGLTSGYIGLYQINFTTPTPPPGLQPCVPDIPNATSHQSNLTVSLGGGSFDSSYDGVGICVAAPQ